MAYFASKSYNSNLDVLSWLAPKPSSTLLSTIPQSEAQCWLIPNFRLLEGNKGGFGMDNQALLPHVDVEYKICRRQVAPLFFSVPVK